MDIAVQEPSSALRYAVVGIGQFGMAVVAALTDRSPNSFGPSNCVVFESALSASGGPAESRRFRSASLTEDLPRDLGSNDRNYSGLRE